MLSWALDLVDDVSMARGTPLFVVFSSREADDLRLHPLLSSLNDAGAAGGQAPGARAKLQVWVFGECREAQKCGGLLGSPSARLEIKSAPSHQKAI